MNERRTTAQSHDNAGANSPQLDQPPGPSGPRKWHRPLWTVIGILLVAFGVLLPSLIGPRRQNQSTSSLSLTNLTPEAKFTDITGAAGINFVHSNGAYGEKLLPETMGGGVAFFDFDNDGHQDLLFINSSDWPWKVQ